MLTLGEDLNMFKGIKMARRGPSISHLLFADDALLFFKTSQDACLHIQNISNRFCLISGSKINFQKSYIKFSPNTSTI